jgi:hypothetical protein
MTINYSYESFPLAAAGNFFLSFWVKKKKDKGSFVTYFNIIIKSPNTETK